jgi:4'-phosphopantetheinyl transferase
MALQDCKLLNPNRAYAIWLIQETDYQLSIYAQQAGLTLTPAAVPSHPKKKQEHIAARLAYQTAAHMLNLPISPLLKDERGAPYRADKQAYISLSHAFPFAIAMIAKDTPVGIDLQLFSTKLERVQQKYLHYTEQQDTNPLLEKLLIYWCAKEAIYKVANLPGLPLTAIEIGPFSNQPTGILYGRIEQKGTYYVHYQVEKAYTVAWAYPDSRVV